jgi:hypothetical protein
VATAVAVGYAEAVYVAVLETGPGGTETNVVHRLGPL